MNGAEKLLEPTIFFNLYTKSPYQNYEWDLLKLSSTCISFDDSSKAVQILLIIFLYFMFLCCLRLGIYMLKTWPRPCTVVVCAGEGAQSMRCSSSIARMILQGVVFCLIWFFTSHQQFFQLNRDRSSWFVRMWDCRSWNIRSHSRRFAMMRLRSYLCAPNRI